MPRKATEKGYMEDMQTQNRRLTRLREGAVTGPMMGQTSRMSRQTIRIKDTEFLTTEVVRDVEAAKTLVKFLRRTYPERKFMYKRVTRKGTVKYLILTEFLSKSRQNEIFARKTGFGASDFS